MVNCATQQFLFALISPEYLVLCHRVSSAREPNNGAVFACLFLFPQNAWFCVLASILLVAHTKHGRFFPLLFLFTTDRENVAERVEAHVSVLPLQCGWTARESVEWRINWSWVQPPRWLTASTSLPVYFSPVSAARRRAGGFRIRSKEFSNYVVKSFQKLERPF